MNNVNSIYSLQKYCTLCGWLKHMPPKLIRTNTHNQMHIYKTSRTCSVMWCMPYTVWMTKPHSWPGAHTRSRVDQLDGTNLTPSARHVLHHPSSLVGWWCFYLVSCIMQKVYSVPSDMEFVKKFTHPDFQAKNFTPQKCVNCDIFLANQQRKCIKYQ